MKALKGLVPYFLIAALMWVMWLCNINANRLIFISDGLYLAAFYLVPLLPLLMGVIAGRCMRLPDLYPAWRGVLAILLLLLGYGPLTLRIFGLGKLVLLTETLYKGGLRVPLMLFSGLLLGRLTLLLSRRRAKDTAPE